MRNVCLRLAVLVLVALATARVQAQGAKSGLLIYKIGRTGFILQGRIQVNPGATVSFKHPTFGELYFGLKQVDIKYAPTNSEQYNKMFNKAVAAKNADDVFAAGVWALKHGLLPSYYKAVEQTLKLNPQHERALKVMTLRQQMDITIGDSSKQEKELSDLVKKKDMKFALSKHYILMHDTPDKPPKPVEGQKKRKPKAQERLDLLETVYESFMLMFYSQGVELVRPEERMKVVLFNEHADYLNFATALDPDLQSASGFWVQDSNTAFFFAHSTTDTFKEINKVLKEIKAEGEELRKAKSPAAKHLIRFEKTLTLLLSVEQENLDISVVSHECTHQMAGNTGLLPIQVQVPSWVHEGLATYFEAPGDATWAGIGAVNADRLDWYRGLEPDRVHSNIDFIVGDEIFDKAGNLTSTIHGYGQAWALTHFLLENHFDKFISFYRLLGEMPRDTALSADVLNSLFTKVFGEDRKGLDQEWRSYMRGLKTDTDKILDRE